MKEPQQTLVSYLLGEMSEAEQTALEQEYFADSQLFDQLVGAENDLLDQYARGQLSPETRRRCEQYYLAHPKRLDRSKFAVALAAKLDRAGEMPASSRQTESWWARMLTAWPGPKLAWALSLAFLLLMAGVIWLAMQTRRLHQEMALNEVERTVRGRRERDLQQQLTSERSRADQLAAELDRLRSEEENPRHTPKPANLAPMLATLLLNITCVRGAETGPPARLVIAPETLQARIQLHLSNNDYQKYSIVIQRADGKLVFTRDHLQAGKPRATLTVIVPASQLSNGDYILTLKGVTPGGDVENVSKLIFRVSQNQPR